MPFDGEINTQDLHLRLWRAASPRSDSQRRSTAEAGQKYLTARGCEQSPTVLFDAAHYLRQLPWFVRDCADPLDHYLRTGWALGLSPHLAFDTAYLGAALGIRAWTEPPLLAYFEHNEEVSPHPLFDLGVYARHIDTDRLPCARLFEVFIGCWRGAHAPFSRLFSIGFYSKFEPVVLSENVNPLMHYLTTEKERRRDPNPMLHNEWYDLRYPARPGQPADPLIRFARFGLKEGHLPNPFAARQMKLHDACVPVPRDLLLEYVDISGTNRTTERELGQTGMFRSAAQ